jgi:hypothetical protein
MKKEIPLSNNKSNLSPRSFSNRLFFIYFFIAHGYLSLLIFVLALHQTGTFQNIDWPVLFVHFLFI